MDFQPEADGAWGHESGGQTILRSFQQRWSHYHVRKHFESGLLMLGAVFSV